MHVIQAAVVHDVLAQRKIVLDQLRQGLQILGFGKKMSQHPNLFEELFLARLEDFTAQEVLDVLDFQVTNKDEEETKTFVMSWIRKETNAILKKFLVFSTGSPRLPNFGLGRIDIKFEADVSSIFASTCVNSVTFPSKFPNEELLVSSLNSVLDSTGRSFNCI